MPCLRSQQYIRQCTRWPTALVSPKLLIHVFNSAVGLRAIAKSGEKMSTGDRVLNWASIFIGAIVGAFTGWYIYRKTMARAKELEQEEVNDIRDSVRRTGMPPRQFSDDPETQAAADTLVDEDDMDYFDEVSSPAAQEYRDQTDDEDVFGEGDGDDEDGNRFTQAGQVMIRTREARLKHASQSCWVLDSQTLGRPETEPRR